TFGTLGSGTASQSPPARAGLNLRNTACYAGENCDSLQWILPGRKGSTAARRDRHAEMGEEQAVQNAKSDRVFGHTRKATENVLVRRCVHASTQDQQRFPKESCETRE